MRMQRNFYEVLGVHRNAAQHEIKEKYLNLARQYHPDRAKDKQIADRLFVQINKAYTTLRDPAKRAQYDATLIAMTQAGAPPTGPSTPSQPFPQAQAQPFQQPQQYQQAQRPTQQQLRDLFEQASRLQLRGDLAKALELCTTILAVEPANFSALALSADLLTQTGRENEALAVYQKAIAIHPNNRMLQEKIARLTAIKERRTTQPGTAPRTNPPIGNPPSASQPTSPSAPSAARPEPPLEQSAPKSFFDKLIHRK